MSDTEIADNYDDIIDEVVDVNDDMEVKPAKKRVMTAKQKESVLRNLEKARAKRSASAKNKKDEYDEYDSYTVAEPKRRRVREPVYEDDDYSDGSEYSDYEEPIKKKKKPSGDIKQISHRLRKAEEKLLKQEQILAEIAKAKKKAVKKVVNHVTKVMIPKDVGRPKTINLFGK